MTEYTIPPIIPTDLPLRVELTDDQVEQLTDAYTLRDRINLLESWGGSWDSGERERFAEWFTTTGGIHD